MKYYLAADGGGTKLDVVLYDDNFHLVNQIRMGGTNSESLVREELLQAMTASLRALIPPETRTIERIDICVLKYSQEFLDALSNLCKVKKCCSWSEADICLAAAGYRYGAVALAGTGSFAGLVTREETSFIGGFGHLLGDEGSGYAIGCQALKHVLQAGEHRAQPTRMTDALLKEWKVEQPRDLIWRVMADKDYKSRIASVSHIAAKAAGEGDQVALGIFECAGHEMAQLMIALLDAKGGVWEGPIIAAGGGWKGCGRMFLRFRRDIHSRFPQAAVIFPVFEPVIGCIVLRYWEENGQAENDAAALLARNFQPFLFSAPAVNGG